MIIVPVLRKDVNRKKLKVRNLEKKPFLFIHAKNRVLYPKETIPGLIFPLGGSQKYQKKGAIANVF